MNDKTPKIAALLFGSGMAALVYQTAWERMLRLVFGASTAASSAVLAIFLGGLGVGGAWLGRRAEKSERPLLLYGNFELGVALSAGASPFLVELVSRVYYALGGQSVLGSIGATVARLVLAAVVLGPAVVLMGGTLPAAARAAESKDDVARGRLALLYASNTAGAVTGALLGTFLLFELFGTRLSLWVAALINALVALLARQMGRNLVTGRQREEEAEEPPSQGVERVAPSVVYGSAAVVGFAFLGLEIVWYRVLGPILGGSSFTFGLILAWALAGIGLGSWAYARRPESKPATLALLALTVAVEAAFVGLPLAFGDGIGLFAAYLRSLAGLGFWALVGSWCLVALFVVFPAAWVSGYQFPVLIGLLGRGRREIARQVGLAYAFNTAGAIVGALLVGFVLLPRLGAIGTWRLVVASLVVLALGLLVQEIRSSKGVRRAWPAAVSVVVAAALLFARGPTAVTRHSPIGAGRVQLADADRNAVREWMSSVRFQLYWEKDGVESAVGVLLIDGLGFLVNGKSDGGIVGDRGTQALLGVLPAILHPEPKRSFVLGLGTGMTAGYLAGVEGMERVDVAELEPAILRVARDSAAANQHVLDQKNVHVFLGDGREFLQTQGGRYDLIVSEPSNPYRAGVASLFTREFYQMAKQHLAPGGLFAQWVQAYDIDANTFRIVLATLYSVFPYVEAWQPQSGDFVLIAGDAPRSYDLELLRQRVQKEPYRTVLPRAGLIQDAEGVLSRFVAGNDLMKGIAQTFDPPINTDDSTVLEYAFARSVGTGASSLTNDLSRITVARDLARASVRGEVDWRRVNELRNRAWLVTGTQPEGLPHPDRDTKARADAVTAGCLGDVNAALARWRSQPKEEPADLIETYVLGGALAQPGDARAVELANRLESAGYVAESHVIMARYASRRGTRAEATEHLFAALGALRRTALSLCDTSSQAIALLPIVTKGEPALRKRAAEELLAGPLAGFAQDARRRQQAQMFAFEAGDPELCLKALGPCIEQPIWTRSFLEQRAQCLERAGHPLTAKAKEDVAEWVNNSQGSIGAGLDLPPPHPSFELPPPGLGGAPAPAAPGAEVPVPGLGGALAPAAPSAEAGADGAAH